MDNVFRPESHNNFTWDKLGDIAEGREELGESMPVLVYRLLEYSMNDILTHEFGADKGNELFRKSGFLAGSEYAKNALDLKAPFGEFVAALQKSLKDLKVGILRIESFDEEKGTFVLTVGEDLDCSGLPPTNEVVCNYDEGFLAGILEAYTGKHYHVREIDCWANGARVCRFRGEVVLEPDITLE
ncbi:MAG: 4-vinyl reductase [Atopobiaceae bacterium]|nr:4-vinyl reductase [Atopobiaceae bacterium]MCI2172686.1 4-vinyl reductase [Atopobiaceae bacterium]MCI2206993.1 4-vinyl reductase [Atopobiaceae bacterium]